MIGLRTPMLAGHTWELGALVASLAGVVVAAWPVPTPVALVLLAGFVLAGPGCLLQSLIDLPAPTRWVAVPALGIAAAVLVTTGMAWFGLWAPRISLGLLAGLVAAGAGVTLAVAMRRASSEGG